MDFPSIIFVKKIAIGKLLSKCSSIATNYLYLVECYVFKIAQKSCFMPKCS